MRNFIKNFGFGFSSFILLVLLHFETSKFGFIYSSFTDFLLPAMLVILLVEKKITSIITFTLWLVYEAIVSRHLNVTYIVVADIAWLGVFTLVSILKNKMNNYYITLPILVTFCVIFTSQVWNVYSVISGTYPSAFSDYIHPTLLNGQYTGYLGDIHHAIVSSVYAIIFYFVSKKSNVFSNESEYHDFK